MAATLDDVARFDCVRLAECTCRCHWSWAPIHVAGTCAVAVLGIRWAVNWAAHRSPCTAALGRGAVVVVDHQPCSLYCPSSVAVAAAVDVAAYSARVGRLVAVTEDLFDPCHGSSGCSRSDSLAESCR